MFEFKTPELSDKKWFDELVAKADYRGCEYNFTSIFSWSESFSQKVAQLNGFLLVRVDGIKSCRYLFPAGSGDLKTVLIALMQYTSKFCKEFNLIGVTDETRRILEDMFPNQFQFRADRNASDYLYKVDKLADLPGKKLHAKRTHINRFMEEHGDWVFEPITSANIDECYAMDVEWTKLNRADEQGQSGDESAMKKVFENYAALKLEGGLLRSAGRCIGFTMGERLNSDTYDTHFEKAFASIQGAYAMVNREFARWIRNTYPDIVYVNREDDVGMEGLRRAKLSYIPDAMVDKYSASLKPEHIVHIAGENGK